MRSNYNELSSLLSPELNMRTQTLFDRTSQILDMSNQVLNRKSPRRLTGQVELDRMFWVLRDKDRILNNQTVLWLLRSDLLTIHIESETKKTSVTATTLTTISEQMGWQNTIDGYPIWVRNTADRMVIWGFD